MEAFQSLHRKLFAILHEKIDYPRVAEVSPPALVIETRTAHAHQNLIKSEAAIQMFLSLLGSRSPTSTEMVLPMDTGSLIVALSRAKRIQE